MKGLSQTLQIWDVPRNPQWEQDGMVKLTKTESKMVAGRHLEFRFRGYNFWTPWARLFNFGTGQENHEPNMAKLPKLRKIKIQDGRRPPSWTSVKNFWTVWARNVKFSGNLEISISRLTFGLTIYPGMASSVTLIFVIGFGVGPNC